MCSVLKSATFNAAPGKNLYAAVDPAPTLQVSRRTFLKSKIVHFSAGLFYGFFVFFCV
jgi:hypothetical protein